MSTTMVDGRPQSLPGRVRAHLGPAMLVAAAGFGVAFFWLGLVSLADAWSIPEYSHGPIIPFISLFLFLREMRAVPPSQTTVRDRWPGLVVLMLGLAVGTLGILARIDNIVTYGMIVWIAGLVLISFGWRRGVLFWPAVLHLVFMLPLPQFVYWQVSSFLQYVSSEIGVAVIAAMGIPVFLDGNIIDLGVYKLQVADACSGLRYLFPMLSFSYVFAVLYTGPIWHKAVLLLSAAPITVLMNSFRVGMIGVMVDNYGIAHAEGFLHAFEGWVIFASCVALLFGLTVLMQQLQTTPKRLSETLDLEFDGLPGEAMRFLSVAPSAALSVAVAATALAAVMATATPARDVAELARSPFVLFPRTIDTWRGVEGAPLDRNIERVLGADDYYQASFSEAADELAGLTGGSHSVNLFMAYYHNQMDGTGIHSPEVCIPAGGWEVSAWSTEQVRTRQGIDVELNRAVIQKGAARQLVYFWFELRGERVASDYQAKFINLRDSAIDGRSDGALVRLITPIVDGNDDADARLRRFMEAIMPELPRFIPG